MPTVTTFLSGNWMGKAISWGIVRDSLQWIKVSSKSNIIVCLVGKGNFLGIGAGIYNFFFDFYIKFMKSIEDIKWFLHSWWKLEGLSVLKALIMLDI